LPERSHLGAGLFEAHLGFEKSYDVEVIRALAPDDLFGSKGEGNPELGWRGEVEAGMGKLEIGRRYADDRARRKPLF
jgi:hypothetical protein